MEDSDKPKETSGKPNNEALALKQLKSIKVALWTLVTVFVILPVIAGIGTGVVIGFIALSGGGAKVEAKEAEEEWGEPNDGWADDAPMEEGGPGGEDVTGSGDE